MSGGLKFRKRRCTQGDKFFHLAALSRDVRFTPNSGHVLCTSACPLCHKRTLESSAPIKGNPRDIARGLVGGNIICQTIRTLSNVCTVARNSLDHHNSRGHHRSRRHKAGNRAPDYKRSRNIPDHNSKALKR